MRLLVNCALPYANNPLHLGHIAGAYLGPDVFVRYNRMVGNEVMFVSGSDEYGTAITIQADRLNVKPSELADKFHREHEESFRNLDIDFDIFSRTTAPVHHETVKEIFLDLLKSGYLEPRKMIAPFCPTCNRFMPDRYITGKCPNCGYEEARGDQCENCGKILDPRELIQPVCSVSGDTPEFRETEHFFFLLSKFQEELSGWLDSKGFWKRNVLEFTRNFVNRGLEDRPVTRDLEWGVEVPVEGFEKKRIYVWFEALLGYISAAKIYSGSIGRPDFWKEFWQEPETKSYFFMGKDNIVFHTIILPAILSGLRGYNLPYNVVANENMNMEGKKFSKSKGIGYTVRDTLSLVGKDYLRYYLASVLPETGDTDFALNDLQERVNTEFISKYGNLVYRVTSFITKNSLSIRTAKDSEYNKVLDFCNQRLDNYRNFIESLEIKKALHEWLELVQYGNAYMNSSAPWKMIKDDREGCTARLYSILKIVQYATTMIYPFTPSSAQKVWDIIGIDGDLKDSFSSLPEGNVVFNVRESDPIFQKLEVGDLNPNSLDLRVAKIMEVREHPNADRLYILKLKIGHEDRQLVAGLRKHYSADELTGRKIIVICNLKPARIRGEVSNGMLLAADDGNSVRFLTVDDSTEDGSSLLLGDFSYNDAGRIEIDDLAKFNLKVGEFHGNPAATATVDGKEYVISDGKVPAFPERPISAGSKIR